MAYSQVSISNIALSLLGADAIRDFDEANKRARMCAVTFVPTRDFLLSKFDWPFARKFARLQKLALPEEQVPEPGWNAFKLPNDCKTPRQLHPLGSREAWVVMGSYFFCERTEVGLYYTSQNTSEPAFSDTFVHLLAMSMATRMGPSITQDKGLLSSLATQLQALQSEVWESDANIGINYRDYDEDPNNDTFVNPEGVDQTILPFVNIIT